MTFEQMLYFAAIFDSDTEALIQERKRPRKLLHRVLECTMEEVSVAPTKKRVCLDKAGGWGVYQSDLRIASELLTTFHNLFFPGAKAIQWSYVRGESGNQQNSGTTEAHSQINHYI